MRRLVGLLLGVLALTALVAACTRGAPPPTPPPSTMPPHPHYPTTTHVTLFQLPDPKDKNYPKGACLVVALPYHAWVAGENADIVFDIVDDYCKTEATYEFTPKEVVEEVTASPEPKKKKGKFKGKNPNTKYKYTVKLGAHSHDPEFEIWP